MLQLQEEWDVLSCLKEQNKSVSHWETQILQLSSSTASLHLSAALLFVCVS